MTQYKLSFIGRLIQLKGEQPQKMKYLKERMHSLWNPSSPWHLVSLRQGISIFTSLTMKIAMAKYGQKALRPSNHVFFVSNHGYQTLIYSKGRRMLKYVKVIYSCLCILVYQNFNQ